MEIERNIYLEQLILRKNNGLIKVITGIRRCGKSFLLFNIFKKYLMPESKKWCARNANVKYRGQDTGHEKHHSRVSDITLGCGDLGVS